MAVIRAAMYSRQHGSAWPPWEPPWRRRGMPPNSSLAVSLPASVAGPTLAINAALWYARTGVDGNQQGLGRVF